MRMNDIEIKVNPTATLCCPICNKMLSKIDKQHLKKHGLTLNEYISQYPNAPFGYSPELRASKSGINHQSTGKKRSAEQRANIARGTKKMWETHVLSDAQKMHASTMGLKNGVSVNLGKKHIRDDTFGFNVSEALLKMHRDNPKEGQHFWYLRNVMNNWARFDEQCDPLQFKFTCVTCDTPGTATLSWLHRNKYKNTLCKTCFPRQATTSKAEQEIAQYVRDLGIIVSPNDRTLLGSAGEIDIFMPMLNIGIEYHGLYWHSHPQLTDAYRHRRKFDEATSRGIRLIQIFEDEWLQKKDIVKSRLRAALGIAPILKFAARKLQIKKLRYGETKKFLDDNHLQGGGIKTNRNYALCSNDEIISMMSFSTPRTPMNHKKTEGIHKLEIVRYAIKSGCAVIGGAEKILSAMIKDEKPDLIESWADLRYVDPVNNVYTKLGFILKSDSKLGYFYTDHISRFHRYGFRKPKDCPANMKEREYWAEKGYFTIHDCGQYLYEMDLRKPQDASMNISIP